MNLKRHFKNILDDTYLSITCIIALICIALHTYQFIDSHYQIEPLVRLVFSVGFPIVIFFAGRIGSYWYWWLYANILALNTTFQNYTAFVIIVIFISLVPKAKWISLVLYALEIFFVATVRDKSPVHILIHICNCICIYMAIIFLLKPTVNKRKLDLTLDEEFILKELLDGKSQKEIDKWSQNTITNKLKSARERNDIATTDELLNEYRKQD